MYPMCTFVHIQKAIYIQNIKKNIYVTELRQLWFKRKLIAGCSFTMCVHCPFDFNISKEKQQIKVVSLSFFRLVFIGRRIKGRLRTKSKHRRLRIYCCWNWNWIICLASISPRDLRISQQLPHNPLWIIFFILAFVFFYKEITRLFH